MRLAVEDCRDGDFVPAQGGGEGFEGEVLLLLRGEEEGRVGGEAGEDVLLLGLRGGLSVDVLVHGM